MAGWKGADKAGYLLQSVLGEHVQSGQRVWDVGCGAGRLGLAALKAGAAHAVLSDVDTLALADARHNAQRLGMAEQVTLLGADACAAEVEADLIVCNPDFGSSVVDRAMLTRLAETAPQVKGAGLLVVGNRHHGLEKALSKGYRQVSEIAGDAAFQVVLCRA